MEAYQTVMYRDVYVETSRVAPTGEWLLLMLVHCETVDVGVQHKGSWTIQLNDAQGVELMTETVNDAIIVGDEEREASLEFRLKVPDVHKVVFSSSKCIFITKHAELIGVRRMMTFT